MNLIVSIPPIVWLLASCLFFAIGEYFSKKFGLDPGLKYILIVLLVNCISVLFWLPAILQKNQLSIMGAMWSVLSLFVTVLIGLLIFHEHLNWIAVLGLIFAVISVILLSLA